MYICEVVGEKLSCRVIIYRCDLSTRILFTSKKYLK